MTIQFPITVPAISVTQPLGTFYVVSLPARVLLDTAYSDRLRAVKTADGAYELVGSQRERQIPRLREIGAYIKSDESTFPNSIILAPNFAEESGEPINDDDEGRKLRWRIDEIPSPNMPGGICYTLTIPTSLPLAPIIDGQHRLYGFNYCENPDRLDSEMVCSIFIDLPKPYQAFLFATINSNQKSVNKSQTFELFGYNIEKEPAEFWSPDKLAVYYARKLNSRDDTNNKDESPLSGRILIAAENDFALSRSQAAKKGKWMVSMATIVDGIARLFSQNQKRDRTILLQEPASQRYRKTLLQKAPNDKSPLREPFVQCRDLLIYAAIKNFLLIADELFWSKTTMDSYICKTVGIQALFDVLLVLTKEGYENKDFSEAFFKSKLQPASHIDFRNERFKNASGSGRLLIKNCLFMACNLETDKLKNLDEKKRIEINDAIVGTPIPH